MSGVIYPINNKEYTAEDVEIFNCTRTSGVHSVLDFDLSLSGNVLTVGKGLAWIKNADFKGKAVAFTESETITLDSADSTLDRYDVVAVRYDATKKEPELIVIKGTASENPVMPKRNTESYLYELFLYSILRKAGESTASFENVTDLRENKNYCGIMEDSVTSAVAPVYETLFEYKGGENNTLKVGDTVDFDYSKYQFFIATIDGAFSENDVILTPTEDKTGIGKFTCLTGSNVISTLTGSSQTTFYLRAQIRINELSVTTGHTVQIVQTSNTADFNLENIDNSYITKLVGVTKQPKGYVAVDDVFNPKSHNAQSGEAVAEAVKETIVFSEKFINEKSARFDEKIAQNQTQINQNAKDISELQEDYDTLNNGGLILKEEFIGQRVNSWLDEHPEATTTVQDGSLTSSKMSGELKEWIRSNTINVKDFGAVGDGVTDDTQAIKSAFATLGDYGHIVFPKGYYIVTFTADRQSLIKLTGLKGVTIDLNGSTIEVTTNGYPHYNLFELIDCENFAIVNGFLKGDRLTHDYTTTSGTHEFGYGIYCRSSLTSYYPNIGIPSETLKCGGKISNCEIYNFTGDGIVTKNGMSPDTIEINNCKIHHCRRQGISVLDSDVVIIDGCYIHHIGEYDGISGANPRAGIDIEPDSGTNNVNSVVIKNTTMEDTNKEGVVGVTKYTTDSETKEITGIKSTIQNVEIYNCNLGNILISGEQNFDLNNRKNTFVRVTNSIINYKATDAKSRFLLIRDNVFFNCIINVLSINDSKWVFAADANSVNGGEDIATLQNCVLNAPADAKILYIKMINCVMNGGTININEAGTDTIRDCINTDFNGCVFGLINGYGTYKFVGCSFQGCTATAIKQVVKFYNCYMDSKYVPGTKAIYNNCTIENEIQV